MRARTLVAGAVLAAATTVGLAPAAVAQPQRGLVNVNVEDVTLQVPIGVAANVCNIPVAVLAEQGPNEAADCNATIDQFPTAFQDNVVVLP